MAAHDSSPKLNSLIWWLGCSQLVGWGTLYFAFTVLLGAIEADLGWSRTDLTGALTLGLVVGGLLAIPVGRWVDRHGGHVAMTVGAFLGAVVLAGFAFVTERWEVYALFVVLGISQALSLGDPVYSVINANLRDANRAVVVLTLLTGLCTSLFVPGTRLLVATIGWRDTLLVLAAIQLVACGLVNALALRGTVGSESAPSEQASPSALGHAVRGVTFWALALCFAGQAFMASGLTFHLLPLLMEGGLSADVVVAAYALRGVAQVASRFILLAFGRDASARTIGRLMVLIPPFAMAMLLGFASRSFLTAAIYVVLFAIAEGSLTVVRATGIREMLGARGYGAIAGALATFALLPKTLAPLALAGLWQVTGSYRAVVVLLIAVAVMSGVAFWIASSQPRRTAAAKASA